MDLGTSYWETSLDMYRRQSGHLTERRVWELGIVGVFAGVVPNHQGRGERKAYYKDDPGV